MRNILIIILTVCCLQSAEGQSGFMGKRNELTFDLHRAIHLGHYHLSYKRMYAKHFAIYGELGYHSVSRSFDVAITAPSPLLTPSNTWQGFEIAGGFLVGGPYSNMALPIGYYGGAKMAYVREEMVEFASDLSSAAYNINRFVLKIELGKDFYLPGNFTLDFGVEAGYAVSFFKNPDNPSMRPQETESRFFPYLSVESLDASTEIDPVTNESVITGFTSWSGFITPFAKIGYLF